MTVETRPVPPGYLLWLTAGFIVWGSAIVVIYAVHAIGCAFAWSAVPLRLGLLMVFLAHLAVIAWMWWHLGGADAGLGSDRTAAFLRMAAVWTTVAAFATTIFTIGATMLLSVCV